MDLPVGKVGLSSDCILPALGQVVMVQPEPLTSMGGELLVQVIMSQVSRLQGSPGDDRQMKQRGKDLQDGLRREMESTTTGVPKAASRNSIGRQTTKGSAAASMLRSPAP